MGVNQLRKNIEKGKSGKNIGISTGLPDIDSVIYGIQKRFIYTIGADTSGGKTSFANYVFVYNLLKNRGNSKVQILYYSFEMSASILYAKLLSLYIYDTYKKVITFEEILSLTDILSEENEKFINEALVWLEEEIEPYFTIYDKALSPNGIYATCKSWLEKFGEFRKIDDHREEYIPEDPDMVLLSAIDHVGLITGSGTKKERIDLTVDYFIFFRNKCGVTTIFIQQLNRNAKSMDRKLNGYELIQLDDFKDTSYTTDSSEVVIALFYPFREKIARCEHYPIQNVLRGKFRLAQILKNRYGRPDVNKGLIFHGEIGSFIELPKPEEITNYDVYLNLENNINQIATNETDNNNNLIYQF